MPGTFRDYRAAHPSSPSLVVEISETSLVLDRAHKGSLYARAGLVDYWIVNLPERRLEVYRDPELDATWRAASREQPPAALDDAIRAAARREVGAKPGGSGAAPRRELSLVTSALIRQEQ